MARLKRLALFCGLAGLLLGSAAPPPAPGAAEAKPRKEAGRPPQPPTEALSATPDDYAIPAPPPTNVAPAAEAAPPAAPAPASKADAKPSSKGKVEILVSLPQQKLYLFKGGRLFATSRVSTGKPGHETPAGTFRILQKKVHHRSNRYANAPMPYMQRLTWYGIALHAGKVPGYRASHGCIRLPWSFARKPYGMTSYSTEVTITHARPKSAAAAAALVQA